MEKRWLLAAAALMVALTGCSKGEPAAAGSSSSTPAASSGTPAPNMEPAALSVYQLSATLTDSEFDEYFVQPIKKKFPHITLKLVRNGKGSSPQELVTTGQFPDIVFTDNNSLSNQLRVIDNRFDLSDHVKKSGMDLKKLDPIAIEGIKMYGDNGELYALPFSLNWTALFYNKDIFDKFGVAYPKDSMTWEDTIELAKKVTRSVDGTFYMGLDPNLPYNVGSGLSLPVVDKKTNQATLNNDQWKRIYTTLKDIYAIPGNLPSMELYGKGRDTFTKDKSLAMYAFFGSGTVGTLEEMYAKGDKMNWDMVSTPSYKEAAGRGQEINIHLMTVSKSSKYKEQAFQVVSYLALSDEVQTLAMKNGRISALQNQELRKSFGANLKTMQGKNVNGIFRNSASKLPAVTGYDSFAKPFLNNKFKEVVAGNLDINTALRQAEEEANKTIQAELKK
jgi:multiple sugar transport system substrate-binding protein